MRLLIAALLGAVTVEAFGPPAASSDAAPIRQADFSPIDFSSTTERLDTTRLNYDGTGERPQEVSDDLPEDPALRVIGPPFAFGADHHHRVAGRAFQVGEREAMVARTAMHGDRWVRAETSRSRSPTKHNEPSIVVDGVLAIVVDAFGASAGSAGAAPPWAKRVARVRARLPRWCVQGLGLVARPSHLVGVRPRSCGEGPNPGRNDHLPHQLFQAVPRSGR